MTTTVLHLKSRATARALPGLADSPVAVVPHRAPTFDSRALLRGQREILIEHAGEVYRLRHTRNDRLILTK